MEHLADVLIIMKKNNEALVQLEEALKTELDERDRPRIERNKNELKRKLP